MTGAKRIAAALTMVGISLLILTGCVPGGYSVDTLKQQPEAALTYPGSTDVHTDDYNGSPGNMFGRGGVAMTGKSGTTIDTQAEVLAFYSQALEADGWKQTQESAQNTTPTGIPDHFIVWVKNKLDLSYLVDVWTENGTTKYYTQLRSSD